MFLRIEFSFKPLDLGFHMADAEQLKYFSYHPGSCN